MRKPQCNQSSLWLFLVWCLSSYIISHFGLLKQFILVGIFSLRSWSDFDNCDPWPFQHFIILPKVVGFVFFPNKSQYVAMERINGFMNSRGSMSTVTALKQLVFWAMTKTIPTFGQKIWSPPCKHFPCLTLQSDFCIGIYLRMKLLNPVLTSGWEEKNSNKLLRKRKEGPYNENLRWNSPWLHLHNVC